MKEAVIIEFENFKNEIVMINYEITAIKHAEAIVEQVMEERVVKDNRGILEKLLGLNKHTVLTELVPIGYKGRTTFTKAKFIFKPELGENSIGKKIKSLIVDDRIYHGVIPVKIDNDLVVTCLIDHYQYRNDLNV